MSLLVIGRSGQVARALVRRAAARGIAVEALGRPELDLEAPALAEEAIRARRPSVIINAAAYTAVDKAEDDRDRAYLLNSEAPARIAAVAAELGAPLIHFSTDYVFAGDKDTPYIETDVTAPAGVYGASKREGEERVLAASPRAIVLRTAWVYDSAGQNFVRTMLRLASTRDEISVVADQHGAPTYADDLANAALTIAAKPTAFGIYHCAGQGETVWADFAAAIFAGAAIRGGPSAAVKRITTADYPTRARRPANSRLNCDKLAADYGVRLRLWPDALSDCLDEIAASGWSVG
ncbi:MAG: dTDP-4-dehydrorhamnose reductase [Alphaproteobacteria bacterium]|nr:MAG: dTDP-4-dehydrorhamnose reductase [Alphaproteobacteria bacterium]